MMEKWKMVEGAETIHAALRKEKLTHSSLRSLLSTDESRAFVELEPPRRQPPKTASH
jgi:hypothetical protein